MLGRQLLAGVACAMFAGVLPAGAFAHASLVRSVPRDRSVLPAPPRQVRLFFDDVVRVDSGIKAIRADGASALAGTPGVVAGRQLVVPLRPGLEEGDYSVLWRVVADDGHTVAGVVSFAVGAGREPPIPALSVDNRPGVRDVVSRWLFFAGILLAAGSAFFRIGVGPVPLRLPFAGLVLVFLGGSEAIAHASTHTRFGLVMTVATLVAAVGATLAAMSATLPRVAPIVWGASLLLIPSPSLSGHALDRGRPAVEVVVDALHAAAAAFWVGGLAGLLLLLRARAGWASSAGRFSRFVLASVITLAATGLVRAFAELRAVSQVWSTGYGQLLIVKTGLFAVLIAVGWVNRSRLLPREDRAALSRSAATELVLLAGVVVAVAVLTDTRPGRDRVALAVPPESSRSGRVRRRGPERRPRGRPGSPRQDAPRHRASTRRVGRGRPPGPSRRHERNALRAGVLRGAIASIRGEGSRRGDRPSSQRAPRPH